MLLVLRFNGPIPNTFLSSHSKRNLQVTENSILVNYSKFFRVQQSEVMKYYFQPKHSKYIRVFFEKNVYFPGNKSFCYQHAHGVIGDTVRGYVEVTTKKKLKIRGVRIHYGGYEKTEWTEGSDESTTTFRQV
jgi:hypothetical protein